MTAYLSPNDPGYDTERVGYNLAVEHKPAVVVPATGVDDVVAAVRFAGGRGLGVVVQATGHGAAMAADGQLLIATSRMDRVRVDPDASTARIGAGVRGAALVRAAAEHGLAPVNGSSPEVGVVSYHLGGGLGILGRTLGWAVDHVRAIEIVTADGRLRRVTATREPELFHVLRGAGKGTLGVVVALEIDLHPIDRLYGGGMYFDAAAVPGVLATWARWTRTVSERTNSSMLLIRMPDLPGLPDHLRGRPVAHLRIAHVGPSAEGARLVRPFRELGPVRDTVGDMSYADVGTIHAEPTTPVPFHSRNLMLRTLDGAGVAEVLRHAGPNSGAPYLVELRHTGGALVRPGAVPSALGRRDGEFVLYAGAVAEGERVAPVRAALDDLVAAMRPWGTGGVCANFLSGPDVTAAQLASGYRPDDLARLAALKRDLDPAGVFRSPLGRV